MMTKITFLFLNIFMALYFGIVGVKYVLHREVPDMVIGLVAWGVVAMIIMHAKFQWAEQHPPTSTTTAVK
jgi:hypothetical protein